MGWSQYVTLVMFQLWWLDLATRMVLERKYQVVSQTFGHMIHVMG
jgi:hypothetical protein